MAAALEMSIGRVGLGKREGPIDHGAQAMQGDGSVSTPERKCIGGPE
jgi:hypothetical protein